LHAFLRGAHTHVQVHTRTRVVGVVWAKRVSKEREALPAGISQRSLGLIERQPELRHHLLRPRQRLTRTTAAEDDEVVSVGDDVSAEGFATPASTPVLQEPVHVDVGKQRACHALNAKDNLGVLMAQTWWILAAPHYETSWP